MPLGRKLVVEFIVVEFLFTFALAYVVLNVATLLGGAAAAFTFLYVEPAEKVEGDIEAHASVTSVSTRTRSGVAAGAPDARGFLHSGARPPSAADGMAA